MKIIQLQHLDVVIRVAGRRLAAISRKIDMNWNTEALRLAETIKGGPADNAGEMA